jgi:methionyl-tRNA formyltransferase
MSNPLRVVFAGTPDFAAQALQAILAAGYQVCAVYTQPDRPSGRGRKLAKSAVKLLAEQQQLPVFQPQTLRDEAVQQALKDLQADVMVVVAYGLILPLTVLQAPRLGCINIHASLLPRWRGAAPIQRAIQAGDSETGITIIQMDEGLDTGAMLLRHPLAIAADETAGRLHDRLARLGGEAVVEALSGLQQGSLTAVPQDESQSCYAAKLEKAEARLDWSQSACQLERLCRAFNPWPVAFTEMEDGRRLRIWMAQAIIAADQADSGHLPGPDSPGMVLAVNQEGIDVATGDGVLRLLQLQLPGGRNQPVSDFVNAAPVRPGSVLGQGAAGLAPPDADKDLL